MPGLRDEAVELLQQLLRFNTVNPPGAERPAQEMLADRLGDAGFEVELLGREEGRPNLIARLPGKAEGKRLCLLSHVDTVLADPSEWTHDPWSGDLADGCVWGRGALDMKSQTAAEVAAAIDLARSGWRPEAGELMVVCVVDEETGGAYGAEWLTEQHPDKVRCDMLINEGGGNFFDFRGQRYWGVCCAEKGIFRFKLTTDGIAGHASIPRMGDNALLKMAPLIERMAHNQPPYDIGAEPQALLAEIGNGSGDDPDAALKALQEEAPLLALLVEPTLGVTLTPTMIRASEKMNVIPSRSELKVDCRVPPGMGEEEARARIEEVLGSDGYRLEFTERVIGNRSPIDSPLMDVLRSWVAEQEPSARVVPMMLPGFTDSRWWRNAFPECDAYGFFPHRHMAMHETAPLIHGADERIDVRDLGFAAQFFRDLPPRVLR